MPGLHHRTIFRGIVAHGPLKRAACGRVRRYEAPAGLIRPRDPFEAMTVIALVLAGNLLLAGLFSLVAVALD